MTRVMTIPYLRFAWVLALFTLTSFLTSRPALAQGEKKAQNQDEKQAQKQNQKQNPKAGDKKMSNPIVVMETNHGTMEIELNNEKAPISTANFLKYTDEGFYNGTIFHRVISDFMIQGGGFAEDMKQKPTKEQIKNEAKNGLKNDRGTLAMARTNVVDSATAQFFINVKDNDFLNHSGEGPRYGYAVFGKVISGMDVVDKIRAVPTTTKSMHENVPVSPVIIKSVKRK